VLREIFIDQEFWFNNRNCGCLQEFELIPAYYLVYLWKFTHYGGKRDDSILFPETNVQASTIMFTSEYFAQYKKKVPR
jgi:hypothetical protein